MSLSPSKETFWSQHQETLRKIRENVKGGRRTKSASPLHPGTRYAKFQRDTGRRASSNTPSYLPRLHTPLEHDHLKLNHNLRGNRYTIVPPVPPKRAFVNEEETDSWGEESDGEESNGYIPPPFSYPVPVYPAQPAVIYPGLPGQPYSVFYPPIYNRRKSRNRNGNQNQKKSVRFNISRGRDKPIDTDRMRYTQSNPAYNRLYEGLPRGVPPPPEHDPFDENQNPVLQKYKYIYPSEKTDPEEGRSVETDQGQFLHSPVLPEPYTHDIYAEEVTQAIINSEVEALVRELIRETTNELVDDYLLVRVTSHDPLEEFLTQLLNDGVKDALDVVVKETLQELTEDALVFSGSCDVIDDLIIDEIHAAAPELMAEVTWDLMLEDFLEEEVIRPEVIEESRNLANQVLSETGDKVRKAELKEVSKRAHNKIVDSLCLDYLLALVARQGAIWSESDFANRAMDSMSLSLLLEQYLYVQQDRRKTLDNVALHRLHEKAVTGVALDVFLGQLSAALDEDMADVDEYERGASLPAIPPVDHRTGYKVSPHTQPSV